MLESILVPLIFFTFVTLIILVPLALKSRERARVHETLRHFAEKGQPLPEEVLHLLKGEPAQRGAARDIRIGVILVMVAFGFATLGAALHRPTGGQSLLPLLGISAFPAFLGLGFLALGFWRQRTEQR